MSIFLLSPILSWGGVSFDDSSLGIKTIFYQSTVKEEIHLKRVVVLLRKAADNRILHLDYLGSAMVELKKAISLNTRAGQTSSIKMLRFVDMGDDLSARLNIMKDYYDLIDYRNSLKTSSKYIYGGELSGKSPGSTIFSKFEKTIAIVGEIIDNLVVINQPTGSRSSDRLDNLKYLDHNQRLL